MSCLSLSSYSWAHWGGFVSILMFFVRSDILLLDTRFLKSLISMNIYLENLETSDYNFSSCFGNTQTVIFLPWHWGTSLLSVLLLLYGWCHSFSYDPLCVTFPHFRYACCKRQKSTLAIVKWSSVHHHILLLVKLFGPTSYAPPFHNFHLFTRGFCLPSHCLPPALSWLYSFFQYPDFPIQFLNS